MPKNSRLGQSYALALALAVLSSPALAQGQPVTAPPSEAAVTRLKDQALMAEIAYAQALVARLSADLAASEARGKWAVEKLWAVPLVVEEPK